MILAPDAETAETVHGEGFNAALWPLPGGPEAFKGVCAVVLSGEGADAVCATLYGVAALVKLVPYTGPASLMTDIQAAQPWEPPPDPFLSCFKPLSDFAEQEAVWLVPGWIPGGQISLIAADGGVGKTSIWVNLIAAISAGKPCILDPPGHARTAHRVAFLTTEDSVRKKLKKKLRLAGANEENIVTPDFAGDKSGTLRNLKFGSPEMERFVRCFRPTLCVFDPIQGFIPPLVNMGSRNGMRDCLAPLVTLGEETGTTFLIICHSNKRKGAFGRDRISDSADLWDISRSVMMAGYTENQGVRYLSNEKNNYGPLQETLLFSIDEGGQICPEGTTWKRDREFVTENAVASSAPRRDNCMEWILQRLDESGGTMATRILEDQAAQAGYSVTCLKRARQALRQDGIIRYTTSGSARDGDRTWYTQRVSDFSEMPPETATPWTG